MLHRKSRMQGSLLPSRLVGALQSANFAQEPIPIKLNAEYCSRVKRREIFKQIQYNYRYEVDKNFDPDPAVWLLQFSWTLKIDRNDQYSFSGILCQSPYMYRTVCLMLRQMQILDKQEDRMMIARQREKEVKTAMESCFESGQEFADLRTKTLSQHLEEGERKKMTEEVKCVWYSGHSPLYFEDKPRLARASRSLVYEGKKYSWKKLSKCYPRRTPQCFSDDIPAEPCEVKPRRKVSGGNFAVPLFYPSVGRLASISAAVSISFVDGGEFESCPLNRVRLQLDHEEVHDLTRELKDLVGDVIKGRKKEETGQLSRAARELGLERFREKMPIKMKKGVRFGPKQVVFNIKEAMLDLPDPDSSDASKAQEVKDTGDAVRKMLTRHVSETVQTLNAECGTVSLTEIFAGFFQLPDGNRNSSGTPRDSFSAAADAQPDSDTREKAKLLHKINPEFRETLRARTDNFLAYTESTEYNKDVGEMVTRWRGLQQAIFALEADQLKPENRAFVIEGERTSTPFIFEGSERLCNDTTLLERWLPQRKLSDANISVEEEGVKLRYMPLKRENKIIRKSLDKELYPYFRRFSDGEADEDKGVPLELYDMHQQIEFDITIAAIRNRYKNPPEVSRPKEEDDKDDYELPELRRCQQYSSQNVIPLFTPEMHDVMMTEELKFDADEEDKASSKGMEMDAPAISISPIHKDSGPDTEMPTPVNEALLCLVSPKVVNPKSRSRFGQQPQPQPSTESKLSQLRLELKSLVEPPPPEDAPWEVSPGLPVDRGRKLLVERALGKLQQASGASGGPSKVPRRQSEMRLPAAEQEAVRRKHSGKKRMLIKNSTGSFLLSPVNENDAADKDKKSTFKRRRMSILNAEGGLKQKLMNDPARLLYKSVRGIQVNDVPSRF